MVSLVVRIEVVGAQVWREGKGEEGMLGGALRMEVISRLHGSKVHTSQRYV